MELLKIATDWAKAEVFSTTFFILFGVIFMLWSAGFLFLGKTELAKAYVWPTLIAGILLVIIGAWLMWTNHQRIKQFEEAHSKNTQTFVESEQARVAATLQEYKTIVFTGIPIIIVVCALLIIFMNTPIWRASMITTIAMLVVILIIDGNAHARIQEYDSQLKPFEK